MSTPNDQALNGPETPFVLVGVDGSDDSLRAVRYGARLAQVTGESWHLLHVVDEPSTPSPGWASVGNSSRDD